MQDRGLWRWPPHANLLYPFVAPQHFPEAATLLIPALSRLAPFTVRLRELRIFVHKRSATLWLHPEVEGPEANSSAFQELQQVLQTQLPQCDAQTASHGGVFTPHFTVGHFESEAAALLARESIMASAAWPAAGISFRVGHVVLMARDGSDGQFEPRWRVPLGEDASQACELAQGERFAGMPRERPAFCDVAPGAAKRRRKKSGRGRGRQQQPRPET